MGIHFTAHRAFPVQLLNGLGMVSRFVVIGTAAVRAVRDQVTVLQRELFSATACNIWHMFPFLNRFPEGFAVTGFVGAVSRMASCRTDRLLFRAFRIIGMVNPYQQAVLQFSASIIGIEAAMGCYILYKLLSRQGAVFFSA